MVKSIAIYCEQILEGVDHPLIENEGRVGLARYNATEVTAQTGHRTVVCQRTLLKAAIDRASKQPTAAHFPERSSQSSRS